MLFGLMEKPKQLHVLLALVKCDFIIAHFDLWMPNGAHDIFASTINFLGELD
jgi:thiosulfate reductase cytochrome b subunit